jgi:hypothetical protein
VAAFGSGDAFARYFFYQKLAPSMKSILTSSDGTFADIFKQFAEPIKSPAVSNNPKLTGANNDSH